MWDKIQRFDDQKEHVTKFVFEKEDAVAEAVLYRYPTYKERTVICCSVQSGCPIGCIFCGAGKNFIKNLTASEIVSQVTHLINETKTDNIDRLQIMFMSMGEPFLNRDLYQVLYFLNARHPHAELLVSTIAPRTNYHEFLYASKKVSKIGLQFSIHATTNEARNKLIPYLNKLMLEEIAGLGLTWHLFTGRRPFFNYIVTKETSEADADRLVALFSPTVWNATVSVLCSTDGSPRQEDATKATGFANLLTQKGFNSRVFDPAGQDTIGGGCGQLWHTQDWMAGK